MEPFTGTVLGQTESLQQLKKAEELSRIVINKKDLYEDKEAWACHQELVSLYRRLLINDLEFSLDKKVEQDLWNICFKNYIGHLQSKIRDKRNAHRGDSQLLLSWFLEFSSGFYTTFLTEIQEKFSLDIPFLKSGDPYGIWAHGKKVATSEDVTSAPGVMSCNYLCQHCLVHLGDVARYRNQMSQAETFYRHAISLAPGSGQPYNQIAILEAARGNKLSSVYFYVRAICLKYPFPAASTNLAKMLTKLAGFEWDKPGRVTKQLFVPLFLKLHGLLHHAEKLRQAVKISNSLAESLTSLVVSDSLSTWQLLQVININMWAYHQVTSEQEHHGHFSKEERLVSGVVASLQAALLSSCLLPVYTMQQGTQLLDYFALPAVRILLEWVQCQPLVLRERGFTTRPQIWPGLARLLNEVRPLIAEFDSSRLKDYPLPEDYDMQAFTPLQTPLARYNMKQVLKGETLDKDSLARLRCARMVNIGMALSRQSPAVISFSEDTNTFEAVDVDWRDVREDPAVLVEEIEMLEDIDSSEDSDSPVPVWDESSAIVSSVKDNTKSILKMKTTPSPSPTSPVPAKPKPRLFQRNAAMAAIMNTVNESTDTEEKNTELLSAVPENKKVMFKTPSPSNSQSSGPGDSGSQFSVSQDDIPVPLLPPLPPRSAPRRSWSPANVPGVPNIPNPQQDPGPVLRSKMCVDELDFSVPPPSLHSNVRPPSLFSPAPPPGLPGPPRGQFGSGLPAAQPLTMKPDSLPGSYLAPGPSTSLVSGLAGMSLGVSSPDWPQPQDSLNTFSNPPRLLGQGAQGHNPLLDLISSVERPSSLPSPAQASSPFTQSYSLFSPSAWPGPLLSSPGSQPPRGQPEVTGSMFGTGVGGPSPLERLLHQAKNDK